MALEDFSNKEADKLNIETCGDTTRPYVDEVTHSLVAEFSRTAGISISTAYDTIIQTVLKNDELATRVIEESTQSSNGMTPFKLKLLNDIADKIDECGHFPDRQKINDDSEMYGFAVYIDGLGSTSDIRELLSEHRPDTYENLVK